MSTKKTTNIFAESVEDDDIIVAQPVTTEAGMKKARIKGTWLMHWGGTNYNFEDRKNFLIPADLYEYLKAHGNIYDTL